LVALVFHRTSNACICKEWETLKQYEVLWFFSFGFLPQEFTRHEVSSNLSTPTI